MAEEALQASSPKRTASLGDLLCDLAGMLTFWRVSVWVLRRSLPRAVQDHEQSQDVPEQERDGGEQGQ